MHHHQDRSTGYLHEGCINKELALLAFPEFCVPVVDETDDAVTWTAAQMLGGYIQRTIGAARSDVTPTAAQIITAMGGYPTTGQSFPLVVKNVTAATHVLTVTAGDSVTLVGTMTIAAAASKLFLCVVTSSSTVTLYSIGTFVH